MWKLANRLLWTRGGLLMLSLLTLAACGHQTQTVATDSTKAAPTAGNIGCVEFDRGTFSRLHDTLPTITFVKKYNAARDAACGKGK